MKTVDELAMIPFSEVEMNHLANLPIMEIEKLLGIEPGAYDWQEHYPVLMAKQRVLLAQALYRELHRVNYSVDRSYWNDDGTRPAAPNLGR